jgi:AcrR family transcriptional regulator
MEKTAEAAHHRVSSTRAAIASACFQLMLKRRYEVIRIADIIEQAGVGRSTFYEHFHCKNDVLLNAMEPILLALSAASSGRAARSYVKQTVHHLWTQRSIGRLILASGPTTIIHRRLAESIRPHVEHEGATDNSAAITAHGIAAAQLAMLRCWLSGEASATVDDIADKLMGCSKLLTARPS